VADPLLTLHQPEAQSAAPAEQTGEGLGRPLSQPAVPLLDKLLVTRKELSTLTGLSVRHLARLDAMNELPGRVWSGRAVRYDMRAVREWIDCGCDFARWKALHGRRGR
jgi:hypothetical protein